MKTVTQSSAAQMSLRAAMVSLILTPLVSLSSLPPDSPNRVRWLGLFWLVTYATVMIAQTAWLGWRWLSSHSSRS
jgi:hypothetical protein